MGLPCHGVPTHGRWSRECWMWVLLGSSLLGFSAPSQAEWLLQSGAGQDPWGPPLWWELGVQHLGLKDKLHRDISSLP